MEKNKETKATSRYERELKSTGEDRYILRLYVAGATPTSQRAIESVKVLCEQRLEGRYELEVVDIYQQPEAVQVLKVLAIPTLVKLMPSSLRRLIGDMSKAGKLLLGLGIGPKEDSKLAENHSN